MRAYCPPAWANSPIWKSRSADSIADGFCSAACPRHGQGAIITKSARQTPADLIVRTSAGDGAMGEAYHLSAAAKRAVAISLRRHIASPTADEIDKPVASCAPALVCASALGTERRFGCLLLRRGRGISGRRPGQSSRMISTRIGQRRFDADRGHRPRPAPAAQRISDPASAQHDHRGAPADAVVEIEHVRVVHANAAVGHEAAFRRS
jgi:hypothetical protein